MVTLLLLLLSADPTLSKVREPVFIDIPANVSKVECRPENKEWKLALSYDSKTPFILFFPRTPGRYIFAYVSPGEKPDAPNLGMAQIDITSDSSVPNKPSVPDKPAVPDVKPDAKPDLPEGIDQALYDATKNWLGKVSDRTGQAQLAQAYRQTAEGAADAAAKAVALGKAPPTVQQFLQVSKETTAKLMGESRNNWREFDAAFTEWRKNKPLTITNYIKWWLTVSVALQ